ncbi:pantoate--beta-alanine ligase [Plesiocystis pacifica SIR-1]|uniref:Pantothenate synthetase n=1 Tax=Plesiocystis pacifica SIR-1 TaxID=391625 RepID=A6GDI0_9BACT|nr:pantoate--beta-alanine ligase [Plesiocystis pacifica]EDM76092.1 pantoate--beta-alanine ligase [Plesiocystis pacifica SIR-1]
MKVLRTVAEVRAWRAELARAGRRVAFVPTMGYLHQGHVQLMHEGRKRVPADAGELAISIFVNPAQFNDASDLAAYPRDLDGDLAKARSAGVDMVYRPDDPKELYPPLASTWVEVAGLDEHLCGATRPGHFRGVCTIVCKLWQLVQPDFALFGQKDFQQLAIIRRMHADLFLGGEVVGVPTVREPDGLAMSSRNARLAPEDRRAALAIPRFLSEVRSRYARGERDAAALIAGSEQALKPGEIHYVSVVDADTLQPVESTTASSGGRTLVALAAFFGGVRLIDNLVLEG